LPFFTFGLVHAIDCQQQARAVPGFLKSRVNAPGFVQLY
jgi:hypothetical protein